MTTGIQFLKSISKDKIKLTSTTQRAFNNVNNDLLYNSSLNLKAGLNYDSLISISVCYILICSLCPKKNSAKPVSKPLQTVKFYTIFTIRYSIVYSIPFPKIPDETTDRKHYDDSKE